MSQSPFSEGRHAIAQNVDARTASLLNRLATRRQSSPLLTSSNLGRASSDSAPGSPGAGAQSRVGSVLAMNRASSPATSVPIASRGGIDKGPALQQFPSSSRAPALSFPAKSQAPAGSSAIGIQGRLVNLQVGGAAGKAPSPGFRLPSSSSTLADEERSSPVFGRVCALPPFRIFRSLLRFPSLAFLPGHHPLILMLLSLFHSRPPSRSHLCSHKRLPPSPSRRTACPTRRRTPARPARRRPSSSAPRRRRRQTRSASTWTAASRIQARRPLHARDIIYIYMGRERERERDRDRDRDRVRQRETERQRCHVPGLRNP